ncbi:toprim domain-containing protein [Actinomadura rugatobispora]|uniref:Toprim domain-containing protein n=1 Tax=Actinomadura rugatobispora TaxID=1994 RepID=A0ABW0ZR44_9ACTN|nr:hypothetical protein GCM10010200_060140 [Actinomadura rugatobispora]
MAMPGDELLPAVLRGVAAREAARLRDGTLPWTWWLELAARFGLRYGFTDTLLIAAQWRAATDVRSYGAWRSAGRQVRRGETGIRILADVLDASTANGTGPRAVFDISQTDGLPPETPAFPGPREARRRLAALGARYGIPPAAERGDDLDACVRLAHQLAHALRPGDRIDRPGAQGCRGARRFEADSVAFLVLARYGLPADRPAFPDGPVPYAVPDVGDRILRVSRRISAAGGHGSGPLRDAHRFFQARLDDGWVPAYLAGRGFDRGVQRRWGLGYAPPGPRALTDHLRSRGHSDEALVAAGLARRTRSGRLRDTFRDRAMFAVRDAADGTVAGFVGRLPEGAPGPKYLNGPDTAAYRKGELLYGLHEVRERLAAGTARPVVVEGPLDAIAVNLASGAYAAVATCGLAPTAGQLGALARVADLDRTGLVVALDGDRAGRAAARRLWTRLDGVRGPVEAVPLGPGEDPAGVLRERGRAGVRAALRSRASLMDVLVDDAIARCGGTLAAPEERLAAIRAAVAVIARGRPAEAARQVARVAERTGVGCPLVTAELVETVSPDSGPAPTAHTNRR